MPSWIKTIEDLLGYDFKGINFGNEAPKEESNKGNHLAAIPLNFKPVPYQPPRIGYKPSRDSLEKIPIAIGAGDVQFVEIKVKSKHSPS